MIAARQSALDVRRAHFARACRAAVRGGFSACQTLAVKAAEHILYVTLERHGFVVDNVQFHAVFGFAGAGCERRVKMARGILQRLISAVIVYRSPGKHGPAVVQLPIHTAVASAAVTAPMLRGVAHAFRLHYLRKVYRVLEFGGKAEARGSIVSYLAVSAGAFLVRLHYGRSQIQLIFRAEGANGVHIRHGFQSELRTEARKTLAVISQRLQAVPHRPHMHVPVLVRSHAVHITLAHGGAGDKGRFVVHRVQMFGQDVPEEFFRPFAQFGIGQPARAHRFYLVIAAP